MNNMEENARQKEAEQKAAEEAYLDSLSVFDHHVAILKKRPSANVSGSIGILLDDHDGSVADAIRETTPYGEKLRGLLITLFDQNIKRSYQEADSWENGGSFPEMPYDVKQQMADVCRRNAEYSRTLATWLRRLDIRSYSIQEFFDLLEKLRDQTSHL